MLEIFAGIMCLTFVALHRGWEIMNLVDCHTRFDLYRQADRREVERMIQDEDPDLVTISFPCAP